MGIFVIAILLIAIYLLIKITSKHKPISESRQVAPKATNDSQRPITQSLYQPIEVEKEPVSKPFYGGPAKGVSSGLPANSPYILVIIECLSLKPGSTARELSELAIKKHGESWDKKKVNGVIYRMEHMGLVHQVLEGKTPHWYLR
jgi:hypothetical protein